jgi:predicted DNA-binding transcriptional regulator AlpA
MIELLDAQAVAAMLGVSKQFVERHTRESVAGTNRIPAKKIGKVWRYDPAEVAEWVKRQKG